MSVRDTLVRVGRHRPWLWGSALAFFLLNLALFSTYRVVYAGQVVNLRERLEQREAELDHLKARANDLGTLVREARTTRDALGELYTHRLASEPIRFTKVAAEIRELARRSGLEPSAVSYPSEEIEDYGLVKRQFAFTVTGTYVELRRFVNLLEVTPTFITLEQVNLSGERGAELRIRLTLSTLFADEDAAPAQRARSDRQAAEPPAAADDAGGTT
jgi:type IV pilus assembly protein PilO